MKSGNARQHFLRSIGARNRNQRDLVLLNESQTILMQGMIGLFGDLKNMTQQHDNPGNRDVHHRNLCRWLSKRRLNISGDVALRTKR